MDTNMMENQKTTGTSTQETCTLLVPETADTARVFTPEALDFLSELETRFGARRRELLSLRKERQSQYDAGELPNFNPDTQEIRDGDWTIAGVPEQLQDRRVEITGPVDRKMMINALNSGAKIFMGDFEDATSPTFDNIVQGQINVQDYAAGTLEFTDPKSGKDYSVGDNPAYLIIRPRGWHLEEAHVALDGQAISGSLCGFGLHFFHTAKQLIEKGLGPFYYLPKMESHLEARLWNDVFVFAQERLGVPQGTIKATVLIETLPAAFEMNEILYELREHIVGLNCGRWDYIFSYIKTLRHHPQFILPNRAFVTMDKEFLKAYSVELIHTCHRRGAFAMGGMAAQIPVKDDAAANDKAFAKVKADKLREAHLTHDGTWVAHPALVPVAMDVFDEYMPQPNNLQQNCPEDRPTAAEMLRPHDGDISESGVRTNVAVALEYTAAWLAGRGAVPINNLMEDAATAEISRIQLWQWLKFRCPITVDTDNYDEVVHIVTMTRPYFKRILAEEFADLVERFGPENTDYLEKAKTILSDLVLSDDFQDFLTIPAYDLIKTQ